MTRQQLSKTEQDLMAEVEQLFNLNALMGGGIDEIKEIMRHLVVGIYRQAKLVKRK